jgi:hypothetical protein
MKNAKIPEYCAWGIEKKYQTLSTRSTMSVEYMSHLPPMFGMPHLAQFCVKTPHNWLKTHLFFAWSLGGTHRRFLKLRR